MKPFWSLWNFQSLWNCVKCGLAGLWASQVLSEQLPCDGWTGHHSYGPDGMDVQFSLAIRSFCFRVGFLRLFVSFIVLEVAITKTDPELLRLPSNIIVSTRFGNKIGAGRKHQWREKLNLAIWIYSIQETILAHGRCGSFFFPLGSDDFWWELYVTWYRKQRFLCRTGKRNMSRQQTCSRLRAVFCCNQEQRLTKLAIR